jgi:hypothetical protein
MNIYIMLKLYFVGYLRITNSMEQSSRESNNYSIETSIIFSPVLKTNMKLHNILTGRENGVTNVKNLSEIRRCIQKFPDWSPGARTANGTALCHWVQLYRYFVIQSRDSCRQNPLLCFSTSVNYCCCSCLFRYDSVRKLLDTPS